MNLETASVQATSRLSSFLDQYGVIGFESPIHPAQLDLG